MEKILVSSCAMLSVLSSYSVVPAQLELQEDKLVVQVIKVKQPEKHEKETAPFTFGPESLLQDASNTLTQYPILYVEEGSTVTNDLTIAVPLVESFSMVDGKAIPQEKTYNLGATLCTTVSHVENEVVDLELFININTLKGYHDVSLKNGEQAELPIIESRDINTEVSIQPGSWIVLGGLVEESDHVKYAIFYLVRVADSESINKPPIEIKPDGFYKYEPHSAR